MKWFKQWMMTCQEVAEAATEYLDHHLKLHKKMAVFTHLVMCPACIRYIRQLKTIIRSAKTKHSTSALPPHLKEKLKALYASWINRINKS